MVYKVLPTWNHHTTKQIHLILHAITLVLGAVGIYCAFKFHSESGFANLYSLHSWLGIGTICLYGIQITQPENPPDQTTSFTINSKLVQNPDEGKRPMWAQGGRQRGRSRGGQPAADAGGFRHPVDGVDRPLQRRRPFLRQHRLVTRWWPSSTRTSAWICSDVAVRGKPFRGGLIGAVPWYTMDVLCLNNKVDDTLGVQAGGAQILNQVVAAFFVVGWNVVVTSVVLIPISVFLPLSMTDEVLTPGTTRYMGMGRWRIIIFVRCHRTSNIVIVVATGMV